MAGYLRARDLNPNDADLLADMGNLLIYVGQPKQAIDQVKEAIRLNPLHATWYVYYLGWAWTPPAIRGPSWKCWRTILRR